MSTFYDMTCIIDSNDSVIIDMYESLVGVSSYISRYYYTDDTTIKFEIKSHLRIGIGRYRYRNRYMYR